jgi:hypothetical protein
MSRFQIDQIVFTRTGIKGYVDLIEDGTVFITASNGVEMDFQESDLMTEAEHISFKNDQMKSVTRDLGPSNVSQTTLDSFFGVPDKKADERLMERFSDMAKAFQTAELVLDFTAAQMAEGIAAEQGMEAGTYMVDYDKAREVFNDLSATSKVALIAASLKVPVMVLHGTVDFPGTEMLRRVIAQAMILNGGDIVLFKARRDIQRYDAAIPA